ncbi:RING-type E3 ubiquitin transferase [Ranunculus cassubicifolius]
MDFGLEEYFQESIGRRKGSVTREKKSCSDTENGSFDCNICLDCARDPVVTLCGHLYCWPCIFKWLNSGQSDPITLELQQQRPQCPVCKAEVSDTTLVPLYGRGQSKDISDVGIPRRPPPFGGLQALIETAPNQQVDNSSSLRANNLQNNILQPNQSETLSSPMFNLGGTTTHPMVLMFGEMVYSGVFGNSTTEVNLIRHPNSYRDVAESNPRIRRQEMKAEKSLNRISIFLFCCMFLCLLLF